MVTMRSASTETPSDQKLHHQMNEKISEYERCREERIKENLERMKKLGILDLSLKLKTAIKPTRNCSSSVQKSPRRISPMRHVGPIRRSSRLGNATPISYSEVYLSKKGSLGLKVGLGNATPISYSEVSLSKKGSLGLKVGLGNATPISYSEVSLSKKGSFETEEELLGEGFKAEAYTEEQKKLLGCTNTSWTLCVDGYGKDGKRVYDQIRGKSCHQCRQKTLGYRTECSQCCKIRGQFCGDCLYMRYGENVLEALENPDWVCPVCRGICNCSLCRNAKGRAPTGLLYRKISKLGFKSVAHYLLQTERRTTNLAFSVSAKRSLAFSKPEAVDSKGDLKESVEVKFEKDKTNEDHKGEELDGSNATPETNDQRSLMPKPKDNGQHGENNVDGKDDAERPGSAIISADVIKSKEDGVEYVENGHCDSNVSNKNTTALKRKTPNRPEPMPDSIGARLRARRGICSQ